MSVKESPKKQPPLVLYAEDNRLVAAPVRDVLELAGCRVEHCANGVTALALLRSAGARGVRYDLIVLDNELPELAGLEVARAARAIKECRRTPIILVALEDCTDEARRVGASEFLRKPHNLLTLADAVRRLLKARKA
ncbi:MAG TPA: response regulator [Pyrinomonadaceae bacterium]|nr:response regulator [Pyrinomonadaceae bacterium]